MDVRSCINSVGNALLRYGDSLACATQVKPIGPLTFAENFAIERYLKKLERPDASKESIRRDACWDEWIAFDQTVGFKNLYKPNWVYARFLIHTWLKHFKLGPVSFTNGSEFEATEGWNSIESKLSRSSWTCTLDNFDLWALTAYHHRGLKMACKKRFASRLASNHSSERLFNRKCWNAFKTKVNPAFEIFKFKLWLVTTIVGGDRFSTVPKNNLKNRPICIQPLANILTQRRIGNGLRKCLKTLGVDLNDTAKLHRARISDRNVATIDLKNASDCISIHLVKYLLPSWVYRYIDDSRSAMTLGPDDNFYITNKVSSMGNGFTFELMTMIILALCRSYSWDSSVFGDDIIIPNKYAESLVSDLNNGGFVVNIGKTHINDTYRESCGAHFFDGHGYIESYDIMYPKSVGDLITLVNKIARLSLIYPSFRSLYVLIYRAMPGALFPENPHKVSGDWHRKQEPFDQPKIDQTIVSSPYQLGWSTTDPNAAKFNRDHGHDGVTMTKSVRRKISKFCRNIQTNPNNATMHYGYEWVDAQKAKRDVDPRTQWAKVLMYLASGRRCADTKRGIGTWESFLAVTFTDGTTFRWSSIIAAI